MPTVERGGPETLYSTRRFSTAGELEFHEMPARSLASPADSHGEQAGDLEHALQQQSRDPFRGNSRIEP